MRKWRAIEKLSADAAKSALRKTVLEATLMRDPVFCEWNDLRLKLQRYQEELLARLSERE